MTNKNGADAKKEAGAKDNNQDAPKLDAETIRKITEMRSKVHEHFGKIALSMTNLPRYRHLSISELVPFLLNPLVRDRVAVANQTPRDSDAIIEGADHTIGVAIWASVSDEVDEKIREQIKAGVFPLRLKAEDWVSGETKWLIDVIAPTQKLTTGVIASFQQVVGESEVRFHPHVARLIDPEVLKKMGATDIKKQQKENDE